MPSAAMERICWFWPRQERCRRAEAAQSAAPEIPRGWLVKEFTEADWGRLAALEAVSLHTDHRTLPAERIAELHAKGYRVMLYTVNDAAVAEKLLAAGADGLFTDNLREFAARFAGDT